MIMRGKVTPMFDFLNPTESKTLALNWVGFVEEENKRIEKEGNKLIACRGCTNAVLIRKGHTGDILCEDCLDLPTPSAN